MIAETSCVDVHTMYQLIIALFVDINIFAYHIKMNKIVQKKARKRKIRYEWRLKRTVQKFFDELKVLVENKMPARIILLHADRYGHKVRYIKR